MSRLVGLVLPKKQEKKKPAPKPESSKKEAI